MSAIMCDPLNDSYDHWGISVLNHCLECISSLTLIYTTTDGGLTFNITYLDGIMGHESQPHKIELVKSAADYNES